MVQLRPYFAVHEILISGTRALEAETTLNFGIPPGDDTDFTTWNWYWFPESTERSFVLLLV